MPYRLFFKGPIRISIRGFRQIDKGGDARLYSRPVSFPIAKNRKSTQIP